MRYLLALVLGLFLATPALAQDSKVGVRVVPDRTSVPPGGELVLAVEISHAQGWHTQANAAALGKLPEGVEQIPTEVLIEAPPVMVVGAVQWPKVVLVSGAALGEASLKIAVFEGRALAYVPVLVAPGAPAGEVKVTVRVKYQACDESMCVPPEDEAHAVVVRVDPGVQGGAGRGDPALFAGFDPSVFSRMRAGQGGAEGPPPTPPRAAPNPAGSFLGIEAPRSLLGLALLALLGGAVLNLTPCVLPIIPIKIMTISQHAQAKGRGLTLGLAMASGVFAFWLGIGVLAIGVTAFADPTRIFGIWWITLAIGLLIAIMSLGLMGLFQFNLPQRFYLINPKADTAWGSFWFGVMTAVLGLPCFGFVAGALLAGVAALPKSATLVIFACMGVGMAAPYLVLSAKPGWLARIPRTGPGSDLVKQVMGLLLLAAAAFFVGTGLIALVAQHPYLAKHLHIWAVASLGAVAGLWLLARTIQITSRPAHRLVFSLLGVGIAAAGVYYALGETRLARENWEARQAATGTAPGQLITGAWIPYDERVFQEAREKGHVVVLDFTADWCITCQVLKRTVLDAQPVAGVLKDKDVVSMVVDLTSTTAPGWKMLAALGRKGIPTLAVYGRGPGEPWVGNAYTSQTVLDAIARAKGGGA